MCGAQKQPSSAAENGGISGASTFSRLGAGQDFSQSVPEHTEKTLYRLGLKKIKWRLGSQKMKWRHLPT